MRISESALSKLRGGKAQRPSQQTVLLLRRLGINPVWVEHGIGSMELERMPGQVAESGADYDAQPGEQLAGSEGKERWPVSLDAAEQLLVAHYRAALPARRVGAAGNSSAKIKRKIARIVAQPASQA